MIRRRKFRYLLVEPSIRLDPADKSFQAALSDGVLRYLGEFGYIDASPKVVRTAQNGNFMLRVSRGSEAAVTLALAFVKELGGAEVGFYTIKTSGTLLSLHGKKPRASNAPRTNLTS